MTILVASLFLPYTVQFELDSESAAQLCGDESLTEIFESVKMNQMNTKHDDVNEVIRRSSLVLNNDANLSIIQSMAQYNVSSSNLSVVESIESDTETDNNNYDSNYRSTMLNDSYNRQQLGNNNDSTSDVNSISSTSSLIENSKLKNNDDELHMPIPIQPHTNSHDFSNQPSSSHHMPPFLQTHSHLNSHNKLRSTSTSTVSSQQNMSAQDFFFNNPNKTKMYLSSTSLDDIPNKSVSTTPLQTNKLPRNHPYGQFATPYNDNDNNPTLIKPKPQIRKSTPQVLVNEIIQKKSLIEPKLSSMRLNRTQHSNLRNLKTSSILSLDKKLTKENAHEQKELFTINNDTYNPDSVSNNFTDLLQNEEDRVLDMDCDKISPFGGFSRPHNFMDDKNSLFEKAKWKITDFEKGNGSLIKSIELARSNNIDDFKWIGTVSMPTSIVPDNIKSDISNELETNYNSNAVFIDDEIFEGHYNSFCKQILWPIFHYQIPDNPKSNAFENHSWKYYEKVNEIFAKKIASEYKEGDIVWVHDYHLMLLPKLLRKAIPNIKIGFFLHISFPSSEVFRCLAQRKNILEGMLGADCITFQNEEYMAHFLQSSNRLLLADFNDVGVYYQNKISVVSYNPIGIDFNQLNNQLKSNIVKNWKDLVNERWQNKKLIVSRDKIDKIRGLKEKLLAYEKFLDLHPEFLFDTILILICVSGNLTDDDYKNEVLQIIERINSKTKNISIDQPVILLNQDIEFEQYLALLTEADVFIVSTLREGMNLTCHEFICSTQNLHAPLILSEFVGSTSVLTDGPLISNPYNINEVAGQIHKCLTMSDVEKFERWNKTFQAVLKNDSKSWIKRCLDDIRLACKNADITNSTNRLIPLTKEKYQNLFKKDNNKKLYILNLDELTDNLEIHGHTIKSLQQQLINKTLTNLSSNHNNVVYVFSLFQRSELLRMYGRIPDIGLIAENGGLVKPPRAPHWYKIFDEAEREWIPLVVEIIESFCERLPGSYIKTEECNVMFYTGNSVEMDKDYKKGLVGDLVTHINELFGKDYNVHATLSKGIIFVKEMNLIKKSLSFICENCLDDENIVKLPLSGPSNFASPLIQTTTSPIQNSPISITPIQPTSSSSSLSSIDEALKSFNKFFVCGSITTIDEEIYGFFNNYCESNNINKEYNLITIRVNQNDPNRTIAEYSLSGINNLMTLLD